MEGKGKLYMDRCKEITNDFDYDASCMLNVIVSENNLSF
jgi:hypothetical protein